MRLTCPCCGAQNSLEALINDGHARNAIAAALALPAGLGDRVLRYLGLFRPAGRGLAWDRATRLLEELSAAVAVARIERNGRVWPAPVEYWKSALDELLDRRPSLVLPLKSHGYLHEIIVGLNQKAESRAERAEEKRLRHRPPADAGMQSVAALVAPIAPEASGGRQPAVSASADPPRETRRARSKPPAEFRKLASALAGKGAADDLGAPTAPGA